MLFFVTLHPESRRTVTQIAEPPGAHEFYYFPVRARRVSRESSARILATTWARRAPDGSKARRLGKSPLEVPIWVIEKREFHTNRSRYFRDQLFLQNRDVHGFGKMHLESKLSAASHIFIHTKTTEGHAAALSSV